MVYIQSWQSFQEQAEGLYAAAPNKTRYSVKWRDGKLVLKITDDTRCIKFKTHSSIFLNRFEALNLTLMQKMQNWRPAVVPPSEVNKAKKVTGAAGGGQHVEEMQQMGGSRAASPLPPAVPGVSGVVPGAGGPSGGGVKKKKGKKKK